MFLSPPLRSVLHAGAFVVIVGAMALTPLTPVDAQKGKPVYNTPVELTVAAGGAITSDGGAYANGVDGVSATINASSGDLVVAFGSSRHLGVVLGDPISVTGNGIVPAPGSYEARRLYVHNIGSLIVGQTQTRIARVLEFAALSNHVVGFLETHNSGEPAGGTSVCVTRTGDASWTIATASLPACAPGGIGGLFTQANGKRGAIVITPIASYELPFSMEVVLQ